MVLQIYFWKCSPYFNYTKDQVHFFLKDKVAKLRTNLSWGLFILTKHIRTSFWCKIRHYQYIIAENNVFKVIVNRFFSSDTVNTKPAPRKLFFKEKTDLRHLICTQNKPSGITSKCCLKTKSIEHIKIHSDRCDI